MAGLRIYCFDDLRFELHGKVVNGFDTDKSRALLVYLALENEHPHRRSHLAGLLWSDQSEEQALHSLRQSLSNLRKTLADSSDSQEPLLLVERDTVQLNPARPLWVDVMAFRQHLAQAYRYYQDRNHGGWINVRRLRSALDLKKGPFLAHLELKGSPLFDEWQLMTRDALDQNAMEGYSLLAEVYERRGDFAAARAMMQHIIRAAPWVESAHIQLMRLYALTGQQDAALNQYKSLRRMMQEHFGVEPAREAAALFEQIRGLNHHSTDVLRRFPLTPANLPAPITPFIGREKELDEITDLLVNPGCRLLTLFGPGGIGKTRLALQAACEQVGVFSDGVFFVPLSTASSPNQVGAAVADALKLVLSEQSNPRKCLLDFLSARRILLVLDNYEHLLGQEQSTHLLQEMLDAAPGLILLITSRERLCLQEEWIYPVEGLSYPLDHQPPAAAVSQEVQRYDALALFEGRARQSRHDFRLDAENLPVVMQICQLLEGLPLGVELAASAVWEYPCAAIAEMISTNIHSLAASASNIPPRHRSLRAAFDVSWNLLSQPEKDLFSRLALFTDGFTREAVQQVLQADPALLAALVNQSLLRLDAGGRYQMLETIRQYACEKLAALPDRPQLAAAHAAYYSAWLKTMDAELLGSQQKQSLERIRQELGNARQAWHWMIANRHVEGLLDGLDALYRFFYVRSRFQEGADWLQPAVEMLEALQASAPAETVEVALGRLLARQGTLLYYIRSNARAQQLLERAQQIFTRLNRPDELAFCRITLGGLYLRAKEFDRTQSCGQLNLDYYQQAGDAQGTVRALYLLGYLNNRLGRAAVARQYLLQAVEIGRTLEDRRCLTAPLNVLGDIACVAGEYDHAEQLFQESLSISRDLNDLYYQAIMLNNLATVFQVKKNFPAARQAYEESLRLARYVGDRDGEALALNNLGELALAEGQFEQAIGFSEQALIIARQEDEAWTMIVCLNNLGEAHCQLGSHISAMTYFSDAVQMALEVDSVDSATRVAVNMGRCLQLQGKTRQAVSLYQAVLAHSATEHENRQKAAAWLQELSAVAPADPDDDLLKHAVAAATG